MTLPSEPLALPQTPAGQVLGQFLDAYNRGDVEFVRDFVAAHYADPQADKGPSDDRAVWNSMDYTTALVEALRVDPACKLRPYRLERDTPVEVGVLARAGLAGEWVYLKVRTSLDPPHRLIEFRTRPALSPGGEMEPHDIPSDAALRDKVISLFVGRLAAADLFSGAVLVARDGYPIFQRAYGLASREFGVVNRVDTKFNIGSLNKMFTAVAIAQLAEQDALTYEDVITRHLPDFPRAAGDRITIHHLLAHLSGVGSYWNERFECERPKIRTVTDFLQLFVDEPLAFQPGERWMYSNGGYIILGSIIEQVTGQSYYDYVREYIYNPAGMHDTDAFEMDRPVPNLAVGYTRVDPSGCRELGSQRSNLFMHVVKGGPGGGGFSTVEDLLKFDRALREHVLLTPESVDLLFTGKVELRGRDLQYGYGFFDRRVNEQRIVGHSGNFPGIGAQLDMFLESGYTVAILSNQDPCAAQIVADHLRETLTRGKPVPGT